MAERISAALRQAYEETVFCVWAVSQKIEFHAGEQSQALERLLRRSLVGSAALITAWNPASRLLSDPENTARNELLYADAEAGGFHVLFGEGCDPHGQWKPEYSLLILGIDRQAATVLANKYAQNAYVFISSGQPPELVYPAFEPAEEPEIIISEDAALVSNMQAVCPECSSDNVAPIIYGLPSGSLLQKSRSGDFVLGGCVLHGNDPELSCKECGHRFGDERTLWN